MSDDDPFDLERFVEAQGGGVYERALEEIRAGAKRSHWMWFVFPQHRDLGRSETALCYGLSGIEEARAYWQHPLLGPRLGECAAAILPHLETRDAASILGPIDALKLRSSMEIFAEATPSESLFQRILKLLKQ